MFAIPNSRMRRSKIFYRILVKYCLEVLLNMLLPYTLKYWRDHTQCLADKCQLTSHLQKGVILNQILIMIRYTWLVSVIFYVCHNELFHGVVLYSGSCPVYDVRSIKSTDASEAPKLASANAGHVTDTNGPDARWDNTCVFRRAKGINTHVTEDSCVNCSFLQS